MRGFCWKRKFHKYFNYKITKLTFTYHFYCTSGAYEEYARLTLATSTNPSAKRSKIAGTSDPSIPRDSQRRKSHLMLAYRALEGATDERLLNGWLKWSGAWEAFKVLKERGIDASTIFM